MLISVPFSSVCIIMDDLSRDLLNDMAGSLGMDLKGDDGVMMTDIVVECFNPADENANPNLLDLIFTRNDQGDKETIREQLISQVVDQIRAQFDTLANKTSGGADTSLANNEGIQALQKMLRNNRMDTMIVTNADDYTVAPYNEASLWADAPTWFVSSAGCNTASLQDIPVDGFDTIRGVADILADMVADKGGFTSPGPDMGDCSDAVPINGNCDGTKNCEANDALLSIKSKLLTEKIFRCDLWTIDDVTECDIKDLDPTDDTLTDAEWCARTDSDGSLTRQIFERTCNLSTFVTYVQDFDIRIDVAIRRVDHVSNTVVSAIGTDMQGLVDTHLINPLIDVTDVVTCGYLGVTYREIVSGLCYQGVNGLSSVSQVYVALGFAVLLLILVMDALWMRTYMRERGEFGGEDDDDPMTEGPTSKNRPKGVKLGKLTVQSGETE